MPATEPPRTWQEWRVRRDTLCRRLQRIIRNTSRLSDSAWAGLLERVDREIDALRDTEGLAQ